MLKACLTLLAVTTLASCSPFQMQLDALDAAYARKEISTETWVEKRRVIMDAQSYYTSMVAQGAYDEPPSRPHTSTEDIYSRKKDADEEVVFFPGSSTSSSSRKGADGMWHNSDGSYTRKGADGMWHHSDGSSTRKGADGMWHNSDGSSTRKGADGIYYHSDGSSSRKGADGIWYHSDGSTSEKRYGEWYHIR